MPDTVHINPANGSQLLRNSYFSVTQQMERDYFVYLPKNYAESEQDWPVLLFLHGDGERGNGKDELAHVLKHGPLYEAWVQQRDLPMIIVSPQLPMFDRDKLNLPYFQNRGAPMVDESTITPPQRLPTEYSKQAIERMQFNGRRPQWLRFLPNGWEKMDSDVITILDQVRQSLRCDSGRTYLSGISYGGFGAWFFAAKYPQRFAAVAPICAWLMPELADAIARAQLPVWQFAGGLDQIVRIRHFYTGAQKLKQLGLQEHRFTVHEDMGHDVWKRIYAGWDIYQWLLQWDKTKHI